LASQTSSLWSYPWSNETRLLLTTASGVQRLLFFLSVFRFALGTIH
jgi:hypothetical protein